MNGFPEYHKIHTLYKRDEKGRIIPGDFSREEIAFLADKPWHWTEKVDGTNIRIGIDSTGMYRVGGRTDSAQIPVTLLEAIDALGLREKLRKHFDGPVVLYGEGHGAKIQKGGGNYRQDQGFVLFDVLVGGWWLRYGDVCDVAQKLGIEVVPTWLVGTIAEAEAIIGTEQGQRSCWGSFRAEGYVGTPIVPLFARDGSRIITKIKSKDYDRLRRDGLRP